jgi:tRNA pseudouridine55 synthase
MDGILNINKSTGMTSHDVVAKVRKLLKQKRVGHAGTLDPAASGVLPICVGQATRVAEYLSESGKAYQATIVFGTVTDTYDSEGAILRTASAQDLTLPTIETLLPAMLGEHMQVPPRYSAIKLQGQPAYKRARAGEEVAMEPRPITIYQLEIIDWQPSQPPVLTLAIECSKGTYIRSLAYDLGEQAGCGAYLGDLVRTRSGPFPLSESTTLEQLAEAAAQGTIEQFLYPADKAIEQYPALRLDETTTDRVKHGNTFRVEEQTGVLHEQTLARVYDNMGQFVAIAAWDAECSVWQPTKVFI